MAVMPLVLETKRVYVCKLISLRNLLTRKTTWLVLTTTSATSIWSRILGVYCTTKISVNTLIFQHSFSFHCDSSCFNSTGLFFLLLDSLCSLIVKTQDQNKWILPSSFHSVSASPGWTEISDLVGTSDKSPLFFPLVFLIFPSSF